MDGDTDRHRGGWGWQRPTADADDSIRGGFGPSALRGSLELEEPTDLFLDTSGWGKGYVLVNGFLLGRYWRNGPQRTLYIPAPMLRTGANTVVVIEIEGVGEPVARFVARPDLGSPEE